VYPRPYASYTLLERLATGGMSQVDLARRAVDDAGYVRFVVIKRIRANSVEDDSFVRMFKDEARITSELRHTNIAQVYDFGRVGDEYYLALEYVPGTDLRNVLGCLKKARQRMPVRMALKVAHDVLDALHYAHTRLDSQGRPMRIVHRDVNPRNIMLSIMGEVKLIDFGVARAADRLERTQTDHFKGKVAYMAPEQITSRDLDHRVDIFALGLTLYEMLVGAGPFAGLDQTQILFKIMKGDLPTLSVPREWGAPGRELCAVVNRAIRPDPDERFADATDMRLAVAKVAELFGGLPTTRELRAWLAELDPELEGRVRSKIDEWSSPILPAIGLPGPAADGPAPLDTSGTLDRGRLAPEPGTGSQTRLTGVHAGIGAAAATLIIVPGALAVLLVAAALIVLLTPIGAGLWASVLPAESSRAPQATAPPPDAAPAATDAPRPAVAPADSGPRARQIDPAGAAASSEPASAAPSPASGEPASGRPTPAPRPTSAPAPPAGRIVPAEPPPESPRSITVVESPAEPEPAPSPQRAEIVPRPPAPEPVAATPSEPPPAPAVPATPAALPTGTVKVTSAVKGLRIYVDGQDSGKRTPATLDVAIGERSIAVEGHAPSSTVVREGQMHFATFK